MSKHTPGPWHVDGCNINAGSTAYLVANQRATAHQLRANARLIAAAPELLEALTRLLRESEAGSLDERETELTMQEAYRAIRLATGGE